MATLIKLWVISVFVWPVICFALERFFGAFNSKSAKAIKEFLTNLGWTFIGAGGIGVLVSLNPAGSQLEFIVRAIIGFLVIIFGLIMILFNMENK